MPREHLGRWGRWYATTEEDTAHYSDHAFRAWAGIFGRAVSSKGDLPKLRPLRALYGAIEVDFLISEGRLVVDDAEHVSIVGWATYQAPVDPTNAERQRRWVERHPKTSEQVDNDVDNSANALGALGESVSLTAHSHSLSSSSSLGEGVTSDDARALARDGVTDFEAGHPFDDFYLVTTQYPTTERMRGWITEVASTGPSPADFGLVLRVEFERSHGKLPEAMKATKARLARMTVQAAAEAREKALTRPTTALERPELSEEAIAVGRAALDALRANFGGRNGRRGGIASRVGDVLPSVASIGSSRDGHSLTGAKGSEGKGVGGPPAVGRLGPDALPSLPETVETGAGTEPGEPEPDRNSVAAPDGPANAGR